MWHCTFTAIRGGPEEGKGQFRAGVNKTFKRSGGQGEHEADLSDNFDEWEKISSGMLHRWHTPGHFKQEPSLDL